MRTWVMAVSLFAASAVAGNTISAQAARPRPNPFLQDSIRVATIAEIMTSIAGHENEPAGKVFKNVLLHKDMPAKDLLKKMDEEYGRGLGAVCTSCHVAKEWDKDTKKNKNITREMEKMTRTINEASLAKTKDLDDDFPKATCVMCHRGTAHMPNTLPKPTRETVAPEPRGKPGA
jgi:hypothetical protein